MGPRAKDPIGTAAGEETEAAGRVKRSRGADGGERTGAAEVAGHAAGGTVRLEGEEVPANLDAEDEDFEHLEGLRGW